MTPIEADKLAQEFVDIWFYPDIQAKGANEETDVMKDFVKRFLIKHQSVPPYKEEEKEKLVPVWHHPNKGTIPVHKEEVDKEDELWNEVMQEMGFYSSQLDNIKSKFILIRKI